MSRGFGGVIGAIVGFYLGGFAGIGLARASLDCCYGESGYPVFGEVIGIVIGAWLAWID
jgi:heme/copper-type cytochrome/quinol oxidase subunit 1